MDIPGANIPRPKIEVNSDMQLRKRKLNGSQSKPIKKAVVKNPVSKTIIIRIIHEIVNIIKITSVLQKSIQSSVVY